MSRALTAQVALRTREQGLHPSPLGTAQLPWGHRVFPGKGKQVLHGPCALKLKVKRNPGGEKRLGGCITRGAKLMPHFTVVEMASFML